jgi:hypothetical protein
MNKKQRDALIAILNDLADELHGEAKIRTRAKIAALREGLESEQKETR